MVAGLVAALLALSAQQKPDTSTFTDRATAELVARAQARHALQDTLVHDYVATVQTRVDAGVGRRRFASISPVIAMESVSRVTWARPNDMKIEMLGARTASSFRGVRGSMGFDDPWFIPRGLGDTIQFVDAEIPETGALHPLAPGGPAFYRYALTDSISITLPDRVVRAVGIRIEPRRNASSLVAGNIWVDAETAEVVRMTLLFVGDYLWDHPEKGTPADSAESRKDNRLANRVLRVEAEMEYALHQSRYWMPHRQLVTLTAEIPWFVNLRIPVRFLSTFSQYRINTGAAPQFTVDPSDSATVWHRCQVQGNDEESCAVRGHNRRRRDELGFTRGERSASGRWEITVPSRDSLQAYAFSEPLELQPDPATEQLIRETAATLAELDRNLPAEWVGRRTVGVGYDRFSDVFRFNRVQGVSLGAGLEVEPGPPFLSILGSARFGLSDRRLTAALTLRHDGPGGRFDVGGWRVVREAEPWTDGQGMGNTLNALLAGHDDADYFLVLGGGLSYTANHGPLRDLEIGGAFERHRSMGTRASSGLNDVLGGSGVLGLNPAVAEDDYGRVWLAKTARVGGARLTVGAEGLAGRRTLTGRSWADLRLPFTLLERSGAVTIRGGVMAGDSVPQMMFRLGGPATVRGYRYGTRTGTAAWAARLDYGLGRRSVLSPVVFLDVGNTGQRAAPLVSTGVGLSFFNGFARLNFSKGLNPAVPVRFDLLFRAPR